MFSFLFVCGKYKYSLLIPCQVLRRNLPPGISSSTCHHCLIQKWLHTILRVEFSWDEQEMTSCALSRKTNVTGTWGVWEIICSECFFFFGQTILSIFPRCFLQETKVYAEHTCMTSQDDLRMIPHFGRTAGSPFQPSNARQVFPVFNQLHVFYPG